MKEIKEKIWIAGSNGMVGSSITNLLEKQNRNFIKSTRLDVNLINKIEVEEWIKKTKPTSIILVAAKVGGIIANKEYPAEFLQENLTIQTNVIHAAHTMNIDRLIFIGSSCIYPKYASQPIKESELFNGPMEPVNQWYGIAKLTGVMMCQAYQKQYNRQYVSIIPSNLYGPNDNFDTTKSHVLPALIKKIHDAKVNKLKNVSILGTGMPRRELLYVDDFSDGVIFCHDNYYEYDFINCGSGIDYTIKEIAFKVKNIIGYSGDIYFESPNLNGVEQRFLDSSKINNLGWKPKTSLDDGIKNVYEWYLKNIYK